MSVPSPPSLIREIDKAIARVALDLTDLTVLTEAGSGYFAATPILAARAGAKSVVAVVRDSNYGRSSDIASVVEDLSREARLSDTIKVHIGYASAMVSDADIVTNLGFVRPVDAEMIDRMKDTAVVALMCESWEARPEDVDIEACARRGIVCLGTNEHDAAADVFPYVGMLALQLLLDAGCPVRRCRIVVLGNDLFTRTAVEALARAGAVCTQLNDEQVPSIRGQFTDVDAVLVADYSSERVQIGPGGRILPSELAAVAPDTIVVQLAGAVDAVSIREEGLRLWPAEPVSARRMSRTLASLGPRPVVELHAAGLRVGELAARERLAGASYREVQDGMPSRYSIAQPPPSRGRHAAGESP